MGAIALIRHASNRQLAEQHAQRTFGATPVNDYMDMPELASHVAKAWAAHYRAKRPFHDRMLAALRQRNGVYEPGVLAEIQSRGGSEIFMMLTNTKCRALESWLKDILMTPGITPFKLEPARYPDLPDMIKQMIQQQVEAEADAAPLPPDQQRQKILWMQNEATRQMRLFADQVGQRHTDRITDQMDQGGWEIAFNEFLYDLATFPAAIVKGPLIRKRPQMEWGQASATTWSPVVQNQFRLEWERRSPFDIYPAPGMRNIQNGNLIDRYKFTRDDLQALIGVPGYSEQAIYEVLALYGDKGYNSLMVGDQQRNELEGRPYEWSDPEGLIEALNFWGSCPGKWLLKWQKDEGVDLQSKIDPRREYKIECWKIGRFIIRAKVNPNPLGLKPYGKMSFDEIPGSFWGNGLPDNIADAQAMCNATARSVADNMAFSSGPQVDVQVDRLPAGERVEQIYPWKVWQTTSDQQGSNREAVRFFQPQSNASELLNVYNHFERVADNVSGVPNYSYGDSQTGGAGRTASGLSMLMGNAGKGVKRLVYAIDRYIVAPQVREIFNFNMQHDPDPSIKGDLRVKPAGYAAMMIKDQMQQARTAILNATNNPVDMQIIGYDGRAKLLRGELGAADLPVDEILPDQMTMEIMKASAPPISSLAQGAPTNQPGQGGAPGVSPPGGSQPAAPTPDLSGQPMPGPQVAQQQNVQTGPPQ